MRCAVMQTIQMQVVHLAFAAFLLLWPILLLLIYSPAEAQPVQLRVDNARGIVGEQIRIPIRLTSSTTTTSGRLEGILIVSNPTVFYPEGFLAPRGSMIQEGSITRRNDSVFTFSCTVQRLVPMQSRDTLCLLYGTALAGSDSVTTIRLRDMILRTASDSRTLQVSPTSATVTTRTLGIPLFYIRFAKLEQSYPNPAVRGSVVRWRYRIDKASEVSLKIYTILGQEVMTIEQGTKPLGNHSIEFVPDVIRFGQGLYLARLITNTGEDTKFFSIAE